MEIYFANIIPSIHQPFAVGLKRSTIYAIIVWLKIRVATVGLFCWNIWRHILKSTVAFLNLSNCQGQADICGNWNWHFLSKFIDDIKTKTVFLLFLYNILPTLYNGFQLPASQSSQFVKVMMDIEQVWFPTDVPSLLWEEAAQESWNFRPLVISNFVMSRYLHNIPGKQSDVKYIDEVVLETWHD